MDERVKVLAEDLLKLKIKAQHEIISKYTLCLKNFFLNLFKTQLLCTLHQCNKHGGVSRPSENIYDGVLCSHSYCLLAVKGC